MTRCQLTPSVGQHRLRTVCRESEKETEPWPEYTEPTLATSKELDSIALSVADSPSTFWSYLTSIGAVPTIGPWELRNTALMNYLPEFMMQLGGFAERITEEKDAAASVAEDIHGEVASRATSPSTTSRPRALRLANGSIVIVKQDGTPWDPEVPLAPLIWGDKTPTAPGPEAITYARGDAWDDGSFPTTPDASLSPSSTTATTFSSERDDSWPAPYPARRIRIKLVGRWAQPASPPSHASPSPIISGQKRKASADLSGATAEHVGNTSRNIVRIKIPEHLRKYKKLRQSNKD